MTPEPTHRASLSVRPLPIEVGPIKMRPTEMSPKSPWTIARSAALYELDRWGAPYFSVNALGHVVVTPDSARPDRSVDLFELATGHSRGDGPLLIRFEDVLLDRARHLQRCFAEQIRGHSYGGAHREVYPIKANPQRGVIEALVPAERPPAVGLEVGSKAELAIAVATVGRPGGLIICNGYKDRSYVDAALLADRLGATVVLVIERPEDLPLILEASAAAGLPPTLGVRAKLSRRSAGRWRDSVGVRAKFGLDPAELIEVIGTLRQRGRLARLQLLHFHIGSQIPELASIRAALGEATATYSEFVRLGAELRYLDVGGGLAVRYGEPRTGEHGPVDYTVRQYASEVVSVIQAACARHGVAPPTILTESGRAVSAHAAVLVFDVVSSSPPRPSGRPEPVSEHTDRLAARMATGWAEISSSNVAEQLRSLNSLMEEAVAEFAAARLTLEQRALAERVYWQCLQRVRAVAERATPVPPELALIQRALAQTYYGNFSLFRSAPDVWALDQLFPIMPIHRLDERPAVHATVADLTCDSDGRIDTFIGKEGLRRALPLHEPRRGERYLLALFLTGAYQETLGAPHNLFGAPAVLHVRLGEGDGVAVREATPSGRVDDILREADYTADLLFRTLAARVAAARRHDRLTAAEAERLVSLCRSLLDGSTYLSRG